ncbi:hypothetical protein FUSNEC_GEN_10705_01395 [Fusobacterium necrophorum subsp. funduliforme]
MRSNIKKLEIVLSLSFLRFYYLDFMAILSVFMYNSNSISEWKKDEIMVFIEI